MICGAMIDKGSIDGRRAPHECESCEYKQRCEGESNPVAVEMENDDGMDTTVDNIVNHPLFPLFIRKEKYESYTNN
jgi:hypothetical protein